MKILFIYSTDDSRSLYKPLQSMEHIAFGISYISAVLKEDGHETRLLVLSSNFGKKNLVLIEEQICEYSPDIICFTSVSSQYLFIAWIAEYIKTGWPDKLLVIGGPHATVVPDEVIKGKFDVVCIGEGEYPLKELLDQIARGNDPAGIQNLWIKTKNHGISKNLLRPYIKDLDALPYPDRNMWVPWIGNRKDERISLSLGRGCPFDCTYCSNHVFKTITDGRYVRMRSIDNIMGELKFLNDKYPEITDYYLEVETINLNKKWILELCNRLQEFNGHLSMPLKFSCNYRVSNSSPAEEIFKALRSANFESVNIGLESGSERVRRDILCRNYTNQEFYNTVKIAREYELKVNIYNLIGLPGEKYYEYLETVKVNRVTQPNKVYTSIFFPYPGTKLFDLCVEKGYLFSKIKFSRERRRSVLRMADFTRSQISNAYLWFEYRVFLDYKPRWYLLLRVIYSVILSNAISNQLFNMFLNISVINNIKYKISKNRGIV